MKTGEWITSIALIAFFLGGTAWGQVAPDDFNRLCLHNGGEYYINFLQGGENAGSGKFYPSYTHKAASGLGSPGAYTYPWKILGWSWVGMKAQNGGPDFYFVSILQAVYDNPYNFVAVPSVHLSCTFPAPIGYYQGAVVTAGLQSPIFRSALPSSLPLCGGKNFLFPSSSTWTTAINIFAIGGGTWTNTAILPYYGYNFGLIATGYPLTVPSGTSIWQWVWEELPPWGGNDYHYLIYSGNEMDHNAGYPYNSATDFPGYKGKNHILINREPYIVNWVPHGGGEKHSCDMCLFVEDACLTPVNSSAQAGGNIGNPFHLFVFDVATTCQTPLMTGGNNALQIMIEDYASPGVDYVLLGARQHGRIPYDNGLCSVPHGWDGITGFFIQRLFNWYTSVNYPYPVCTWGFNNGVGGHSARVPIGIFYSGWLPGKEFWFSGFPVVSGECCTAGFMATFF